MEPGSPYVYSIKDRLNKRLGSYGNILLLKFQLQL